MIEDLVSFQKYKFTLFDVVYFCFNIAFQKLDLNLYLLLFLLQLGVVRYKSSKFAHRAMKRFRTGEIVVQDVAVMIKILKSTEPKSQSLRTASRSQPPMPDDRDFPLDGERMGEIERRSNVSKRPRGTGSDSDSTRSRSRSKSNRR